MACKTADKLKENMRPAQDGETNEVTRQMSERKPRKAGFAGDIRGVDHMRPASPVGAAPDCRLTCCRNFGCKLTKDVGPSQTTKTVLGGA